jgi:hypothetical protein
MVQMINIFYNGYRNPNGAITLTEHLIKMLKLQGETVSVHRIMKRSSKETKPVTKYGGFPMNDITLDEAVEMAKSGPSLITHFMQKGDETAYAVELISKAKCPFIIHDPRGLVDEVLNAAEDSGAKIVFIRHAMHEQFLSTYGKGIYKSEFLLHPYIREIDVDTTRKYPKFRNAVTISRIGREKNTTMICEANRLLTNEEKIQIFGTNSDALYSYYVLDKKYPEWRDNYHGEPQAGGFSTYQLCQMSKFAIDMTTFRGDGGGSQYTFMEAMDAGCCLVLHKHWLSYLGEMVEHANCMAAETPEDLSRIVRGEPEDLPGYEETLALHSDPMLRESWQRVCNEK